MLHFDWALDSFLKSPYFSFLRQAHLFDIDPRELKFCHTIENILGHVAVFHFYHLV